MADVCVLRVFFHLQTNLYLIILPTSNNTKSSEVLNFKGMFTMGRYASDFSFRFASRKSTVVNSHASDVDFVAD